MLLDYFLINFGFFKINQYDLSLYSTIVPNQNGQGMFIFYISCFNNKESTQERMTNELCLQITLDAIGDVQLMIIVIDKQMTSLNAINAFLNKINCV
jgi:Zn-finger domain-containing protein